MNKEAAVVSLIAEGFVEVTLHTTGVLGVSNNSKRLPITVFT